VLQQISENSWRVAAFEAKSYEQPHLQRVRLLTVEADQAPYGLQASSFQDTWCLFCGRLLTQNRRGRVKRYCGDTCRQNAYRTSLALSEETFYGRSKKGL
jgi:hypothetical protein